jgi:hypothetical protein
MLKLALLILFAYIKGYQLTGGDLWAREGHSKFSFHYDRLAIDLNLWKDGVWLKETSDHAFLGKFWELLGGTWGGRWGDGNHYSLGEGMRHVA